MNCQMPRSLSQPCLHSASIEGDEADLGLVTSYVQNLSENLSRLNKDMAGCSRGSVGHPELCSRTCLYFATGTCANGSDCDYCHLAHPKRSVHLDKRRRDILRSMPLQEWATLVLPIVQQRIEAVDKSPESQAMLADIAARCGIPRLRLGPPLIFEVSAMGRCPCRRRGFGARIAHMVCSHAVSRWASEL
mmetsp:Transcript_73296/g.210516  ORF Transcript_73296/g.210516 Transcript_73296/m.210516 type:complete len:190 (+) Transcript_73296:1-570(+)